MKPKLINGVLWMAFLLAMAASIHHLAWTLGTVERPGHEWLGWIPAVAVDTGLSALAYSIQQRKIAKRGVAILWAGVVGFAIISALANMYHALEVENVTLFAGVIVYIKAGVLSATLPIMYIFLGEIISDDDAASIAKIEQDEQRAKAKEERQQRLEEQKTSNETKRLELEQQKIMLQQNEQQQETKAEQPEAQPEQQEAQVEQPKTKEVYCVRCSTTFKNRQAYAAHACNKISKANQQAHQPTASEPERVNGNGSHPGKL